MSNRRNLHNLEFPLGDALMMMEAFRLAGNTALMEGKQGAEQRLRDYQAQFDRLIPPAARQFSGKDLCEINMALADATTYHVYIQPDRNSWYRATRGRLAVQIGERKWQTRNFEIQEDGPEFQAVVEILKELAPMDCRRTSLNEEADPQGS